MSRKDDGGPRDGDVSSDVGYGRPPVATRFKKGISGNPAGRPRKPRAVPRMQVVNELRLEDILIKEAYREVQVRDGDAIIVMPAIQAAMRTAVTQAAKGDIRSRDLLLKMLADCEAGRQKSQNAHVAKLLSLKFESEKIIDECREAGIEPPEMIPHPDDIHFDVRTGALEIRGPLSADEKAQEEELKKVEARALQRIENLRRHLSKHPGDRGAKRDLRRAEKVLKSVSDRPPRRWSPNAEPHIGGERR